jgi:hypothetical protein
MITGTRIRDGILNIGPITYPNSTSCTNDSVANNTVIGIDIINDKLVSYQAKLN